MNLGLTPSQVMNLHTKLEASMLDDKGTSLGCSKALDLLEAQTGDPHEELPKDLHTQQQAKSEMEAHLLDLIEHFQRMTGLRIAQIHLNSMPLREMDGTVSFACNVKVEAVL